VPWQLTSGAEDCHIFSSHSNTQFWLYIQCFDRCNTTSYPFIVIYNVVLYLETVCTISTQASFVMSGQVTRLQFTNIGDVYIWVWFSHMPPGLTHFPRPVIGCRRDKTVLCALLVLCTDIYLSYTIVWDNWLRIWVKVLCNPHLG